MADRREPTAAPELTQDLLRRAQEGDGLALDHLCARYLPRLQRWARGRLPRWARERLDTDDLVQETVTQVMGRLESFEPRWKGALQAYFRQALVNRIRDEVRRAARRPAAAELDTDAAGGDASPLEE